MKLITATCIAVLLLADSTAAQSISVGEFHEVSGIVRDLAAGEITIVDDDGTAHKAQVQNKSDRYIILGGRRVRFPAKIRVTGLLPVNLLEAGMIVRILAETNLSGKTRGSIDEVLVESDSKVKLDHTFEQQPSGKKDYQRCRITGRIITVNRKVLKLAVTDSKLNRKQIVSVKLREDCQMKIDDDSLDRVIRGDRVVTASVASVSTGELAARSIKIELTADRKQATRSFDDQLELRFSSFSDEPSEPREVRSDHFILATDISDRSAQVLLAKLETMYELVGAYFRATPQQPILCYVVRDLAQWPAGRLKPEGVQKIAERAGVTVWRTLSRGGKKMRAEAEVYSCSDHGVCQHEAVHAFCALTFGSTGPVWFSEGMAEMGQYWKPDQLAVDIEPAVIRFLQNAKPKKMADIVSAGQITGDSWQAYAWRWALCHLLANNPNYAKRFKTLGLNLMNERNNDSFTKAFGPVAKNISFEYDQFVQNFGNGYRVDLCVWDWRTPSKPLSKSKKIKLDVEARSGWQATRLRAVKNTSYDFSAEGNWGIGKGSEDLSPDGSSGGEGRLIGALMNEFKLSTPFELGGQGTWVAPSEGQLFVRCRDAWTELDDNSGSVKLTIKRTPEKK
jgi:hypothetical protein